MKKSSILKLINFWPPYLGAGVKVKNISKDFTSIEVEMKLRFWNQNYVGSHFGGSLYSMSDPFLMLMLIENLGKDYVVWDKAASIKFKKPGKGKVKINFQVTPEQIQELKNSADNNPKIEPEFQVNIVDENDEIVAEIKKTLYIKRKEKVV